MAVDDRYTPQRETELVLPPGVSAYVLDNTKGDVRTYCGPSKQNVSATDSLVVYNPETRRFVTVDRQDKAIQSNIVVPKGSYVILENPAVSGKQPEAGKSSVLDPGQLKMGQTENLPGPHSFALWPAQVATVVPGHQLRSNQYLLVRVYDEEAAKSNWTKSVIKLATAEDVKTDEKTQTAAAFGVNVNELYTGQLIIIKGTDVSFYIPPTGIEVITENDEDAQHLKYVRDAITLEILDYCILLDENGNKRYVRGPAVVFPKPTEEFVTENGKRKFKAIELTPNSGIQVKVVLDYSENGANYKAGDELFITGRDLSIYFPREEHATVKYGNRDRHFAIAIPPGEARYVLNRITGVIRLQYGPSMFLPNPITEVIVKKVLSDSECELYFPGNATVLQYNRSLRPQAEFPGGPAVAELSASSMLMDSIRGENISYSGSMSASRSLSPKAAREMAGEAAFGDQISRGTQYTPPRTLIIDSKYEGAVQISPYTGYAIQVVNKKGERNTVVGPTTRLLEYDEYLERLRLSSGKPKSSDNLKPTVYLMVNNNAVSDIIDAKTLDLVGVRLTIKYLVRFTEANKDKWFNVENYVQYLCDHMRSLIGNNVRTVGVTEFYMNATSILRDLILGVKDPVTDKRKLRLFEENGMEVYDVEVITVQVQDADIAKKLMDSQQAILNTEITRKKTDAETESMRIAEDAARIRWTEASTTERSKEELKQQLEELRLANRLTNVSRAAEINMKSVEDEKSLQAVRNEISELALTTERNRLTMDDEFAAKQLDRNIMELVEQAKASETRMKAVQPALVEALVSLAATGSLQQIAQHLAPLAIVRGESLAGTFETLFKGTAMEGMLDNIKQLGKGRMIEANELTRK